MKKLIQIFDNIMLKLGYVKAADIEYKPIILFDPSNKPVIDLSKKIAEFESYVYMGGNCLYTFESRTGRIWSLRSGDYAGEHGTPLPGYIEGIGEMTFLGVFYLSD